jgi:hypothetical protein
VCRCLARPSLALAATRGSESWPASPLEGAAWASPVPSGVPSPGHGGDACGQCQCPAALRRWQAIWAMSQHQAERRLASWMLVPATGANIRRESPALPVLRQARCQPEWPVTCVSASCLWGPVSAAIIQACSGLSFIELRRRNVEQGSPCY